MPDPVETLSWDDYRLIRAVAEAGTLPAAAARLGLAHSTVFRRLRQVEAALGFALFERRGASLVPSGPGEELAALARRIGDDVDAVTLRLAGREPSPRGEVRVATNDSLLVHLLTPLFASFRAACPDVRVEVVLGNSALNLSKRDADIAIRAADRPPETLVGRKVASIAWALYGRWTDLPGEVPAGPARFDRPWLSLGDSLAGMKVARFAAANVPAERIGYRVDSVLGLAEGVEAGLGLAHLPCFVGDVRPALRRLAAPEPSFATDLWLLTHPDLRHAARIRVLLDHLAAGIGALRPLIEGAAPGPDGPARDAPVGEG
ncbi:LysR family transcriptional regulator [Aureimonas sp. AU12]|uniref:LysR family transcriptional regulator n=1 Tax=Aureimonas sp. AU12 TaxID=1638161 RepID=UPI000705F5E9|nr:LysR family transcriptional regulator [Aureimonas sp. AU12]BAT29712.1 LysR substrate binding domain protein [Aureimonas sp. AU12]